MSKKANPTAVGIFVTGAVLLLVAGIVLLGTEGLFEKKERFVAYFKGNAHGLVEGADVKFGGVKVGSVLDIHIMTDEKTSGKLIPVVIELSGQKIAAATGESDSRKEIFKPGEFQEIVDRGLTAALKKASLLTGQLYIDLDMLPDAESYEFEGDAIPVLKSYAQIPTTGGGMEKAMQSVAGVLDNINQLDFAEISDRLKVLLADVDTKVLELDMEGISTEVKLLLADGRELIGDPKLKDAIAKLDATMAEVQGIAATLNTKVGPLTDDLSGTLAGATKAMDAAKIAAANVAALLHPESPLASRMSRTFGELDKTARSIRQLTDFLRQNPNALLTGKKRPR